MDCGAKTAGDGIRAGWRGDLAGGATACVLALPEAMAYGALTFGVPGHGIIGDVAQLPDWLRRVFWNVDFDDIDIEMDADGILPRILEHGNMRAVKWALATYGPARIHRFFREVGHPELSPRTIAFWRAYFRAEEEEEWASPPDWRRRSAGPWVA